MADTAAASVRVQIGAVLNATWDAAMSKSKGGLAEIGKAIGQLGQAGKKLDGLQQAQARSAAMVDLLRKKVSDEAVSFQKATERVSSLKAAIAATGDPTGKLTARLDSANVGLTRSENSLNRFNAQLREEQVQLHQDTQAAEAYAKANANIEEKLGRAATAMRKLGAAQEAEEANLARRDRYQKGMLAAVAMSAGLFEAVNAAAEAQSKRFPFKVSMRLHGLSDEEIDSAIAKAGAYARSHMPGKQDILDVQLGLVLKGISAADSQKVSGQIADLAKITGQEFRSVADTVGVMYNDFQSRMVGTAEEKLREISDVVGKLKFKAGVTLDVESIHSAAAVAEQFHIPLTELASDLEALEQSGYNAQAGGKGLQTMFDKLLIGAEKFNVPMVKSKEGFVDMGASMDKLYQYFTHKYGPAWSSNVEFLELFTTKGSIAAAKLLEHGKDIHQSAIEYGHSANFVNETAAEMAGEASEQFEMLKKNLKSLAVTIGSALLPAFTMLLPPVVRVAQAVAEFVAQHKIIGTVVGLATVALSLGTAAVFSAGLAWTFLAGPVLSAVRFFWQVKAAMEAAKVSTIGLTVAEEAETVASAAQGAGWLARIPILGRLGAVLRGVQVAATGTAAAETAAGAAGTATAASFGGLVAAAGPVLLILGEIAAAAAIVGKAFLDMRAKADASFDDMQKNALRKAIFEGKVSADDLKKHGLSDAQVKWFMSGNKTPFNEQDQAIGPDGKPVNKPDKILGLDDARLLELVTGGKSKEQAEAAAKDLTFKSPFGMQSSGAHKAGTRMLRPLVPIDISKVKGLTTPVFQTPMGLSIDTSAVTGKPAAAAYRSPINQTVFAPIQAPGKPAAATLQLPSGPLTVHDQELMEAMEKLIEAQGGHLMVSIPAPAHVGSVVNHVENVLNQQHIMPNGYADPLHDPRKDQKKGKGAKEQKPHIHAAAPAKLAAPKPIHISAHAAGGVAERATLGIFGEAGREAILPLKGAAIGLIAASLLAAMPARQPIAIPPAAPAPTLLQHVSAAPVLPNGDHIRAVTSTMSTPLGRTLSSRSELPKLAAGGLAQREMDVTIGEAGTEAVIPLHGPAIGMIAAELVAKMAPSARTGKPQLPPPAFLPVLHDLERLTPAQLAGPIGNQMAGVLAAHLSSLTPNQLLGITPMLQRIAAPVTPAMGYSGVATPPVISQAIPAVGATAVRPLDLPRLAGSGITVRPRAIFGEAGGPLRNTGVSHIASTIGPLAPTNRSNDETAGPQMQTRLPELPRTERREDLPATSITMNVVQNIQSGPRADAREIAQISRRELEQLLHKQLSSRRGGHHD